MEVRLVYIKPLSQNIKVIKCTKNELFKELSNLDSGISEAIYKSWVLETFIPSINIIFENIALKAEVEGNQEIQKMKDLLFKKVLIINPLLKPENLYISKTNNITLTKTKHKIIDSENWKIEEDPLSLSIIDIHEYFELSDQAKEHDHYIETCKWELLDAVVRVRVFNKSLKNTLMFGLDPKTEEEVKFFVVSTCIDSLHQIYKYISQDPEYSNIPLRSIITSLYKIAIKYNPFLDLKIKDIKKINKNMHQFRKGTKTEEEEIVTTKSRTSLSKVPRKDIFNLEEEILKSLFGQDDVVNSVCNAIKRAYLGLKLKKNPIGTFLFYGPTSTGKTELAKVLARKLIRSETDGLVKIACNTLQMDHTIHTLIGAPPSYVGYEEKGLLYNSFKKGKFKILLFDEIDKATPKLFDMLLDAIEEGQLLLADGSTINLTESIIILTSNIGQKEANESLDTAGFEIKEIKSRNRSKLLENQYKETLKDKLKPELMARLDGCFYFRELTDVELEKIAKLHLNRYVFNWIRKVNLSITNPVYKLILDECKKENPKGLHARHIRAYIDSKIIQKLGDCLLALDTDFKKLEKIEIKVNKCELIFNLIKKRENLKKKRRKK